MKWTESFRFSFAVTFVELFSHVSNVNALNSKIILMKMVEFSTKYLNRFHWFRIMCRCTWIYWESISSFENLLIKTKLKFMCRWYFICRKNEKIPNWIMYLNEWKVFSVCVTPTFWIAASTIHSTWRVQCTFVHVTLLHVR